MQIDFQAPGGMGPYDKLVYGWKWAQAHEAWLRQMQKALIPLPFRF